MSLRRKHLDLTADPTPAERRELIHNAITIAALPGDDGGFRGVVMPRQTVAANQNLVGAYICGHHHENLTAALICANQLANVYVPPDKEG